MKIVISEKQLKEVKKEIEEQSSWAMSTAERIYLMIKNTPFHDRKEMIKKIARMIEK